jgi:HEPN domain-containing protein
MIVITDYVRSWVQYANNNLSTAEAEMTRKVNPRHRAYEQIMYNCQQSAEKMLKAFLYHKSDSPWGHDLIALIASCIAHDMSFNNIRIAKHCAFLNAFIAARYPDFHQSIDAQLANRAINSAKSVYNFITPKLGIGLYIKDTRV